MTQLFPRLLRGRPIVYGAVFALAAAIGASAPASAHGGGAPMTLDPAGNPADFADHVARMSEHVYAKVGAKKVYMPGFTQKFVNARPKFTAQWHGIFG